MPKLVILDPSLAAPGGHHYAFASLLSATAAQAGYEVVLATHRRYAQKALIADVSRVLPLFTKSTYKGDSLAWGKVSLPVNPYRKGDTQLVHKSWQQRWRWFWRQRQQRAYCEALRSGCERLIQSVPLNDDDLVFLPTATEFDLVGLSQFWQASEAARRPTWHLWFHYPVLSGRATGSLLELQRLEATRRHFDELLAPLPASSRVHFHATTQSLVEQYELVAPGHFDYIPYPIAEPLSTPCHSEVAAPLKAVCAGGIRQDKGAGWLAQLVSQVWEEFLASGKLQLQVQAKHRQKLPTTPDTAFPDNAPAPLLHVPHPLSAEAYGQLLQQADCGFFLYTAEQYLNRCSGVLLEMLSSGIPVIVPAGCWLADELAGEVQAHRNELTQTHLVTTTQPAWQTSQYEGHDIWETNVVAPPQANAVCIEVGCDQAAVPGTYLRAEYASSDGVVIADTVSLPRVGEHTQLYLPLANPEQATQLRLRDAFGTQTLELEVAGVHWLCAPQSFLPSGRVGLVAADREQWPRLIRELLACYPHYRDTAEAFSTGYRQRHSAPAFLHNLLASERRQRQAA